jgi:hypothetical protein
MLLNLKKMEKKNYMCLFRLMILGGLLFLSGCDKFTNRESGILEGTISIGPLCPVETVPPSPGCLPTAETYKAFPVYVWTANGSRKIALISPALDGSFKTELAPGNYLIILDNEENRVGNSNLPLEVSIIPSGKTSINIDIDTGIR